MKSKNNLNIFKVLVTQSVVSNSILMSGYFSQREQQKQKQLNDDIDLSYVLYALYLLFCLIFIAHLMTLHTG